MNEIRGAISYFESLLRYFEDNENDAHWRRKHNQMSRDMINAALAALRAQLERESEPEPCKGCINQDMLFSTPLIGTPYPCSSCRRIHENDFYKPREG